MRSLWSLKFIKMILPSCAMAVLLLVWLSTCVVQVETYQQGALYRFGSLAREDILEPGLHFKLPVPFEEVKIYNVTQPQGMIVGYEGDVNNKNNLWTRPHEGEEQALLLGNGNELVAINLKITYRISDLYTYLTRYSSPEDVLNAKGYEVVMGETIHTDINTIISEDRSQLSHRIEEQLKEYAREAELGLEVMSVTLASIHPPVAIADIYQSVVSAGIQKKTSVLTAEGKALVAREGPRQTNSWLSMTPASSGMSGSPAPTRRSRNTMPASRPICWTREAYLLDRYLESFQQALAQQRKYIVGPGVDAGALYANFDWAARGAGGSAALTAEAPAGSRRRRHRQRGRRRRPAQCRVRRGHDMKGNRIIKWMFALIVAAIIGFFGFVFKVNEGEYAVVTRFGAVRSEVTQAGMYLRLPWPFEDVQIQDARKRYLDSGYLETLTHDKKKCHHADLHHLEHRRPPAVLHQRGGIPPWRRPTSATWSPAPKMGPWATMTCPLWSPLDEEDIKIDEIEAAMLQEVQSHALEQYGIQVHELRLKRVGLPATNVQSVFTQMQADRQKYIDQLLAEGERDAQIIMSESDAEVAAIVAEGREEAAAINAETEREVAEIYASAHSQDPELYEFLQKLAALENSVDEDTVMIITMDTPPFDVLYGDD